MKPNPLDAIEAIAKEVMQQCDKPVIHGRGHAHRVPAPGGKKVWRVLAYIQLSTGPSSRSGFTALSLVAEVERRAAAQGLIWAHGHGYKLHKLGYVLPSTKAFRA